MIIARQKLYIGGAVAVLAIGISLYAAGVFNDFGMEACSERKMAALKSASPDAVASAPRAANDLAGDPPRAELTAPAAAAFQVGQDPQALVYVAGATGSANLGRQGLDKAVRNFKVEVRGAASGAAGQLQLRSVLGLEELDLAASGLTPNTTYTLYGKEASGGFSALMNVMSDARGGVPEALAFVRFFDNWVAAVLAPPGSVATH